MTPIKLKVFFPGSNGLYRWMKEIDLVHPPTKGVCIRADAYGKVRNLSLSDLVQLPDGTFLAEWDNNTLFLTGAKDAEKWIASGWTKISWERNK